MQNIIFIKPLQPNKIKKNSRKFKEKISKFIEKTDISLEEQKDLKILTEFDCLKKTNISSYCQCPVCKKTENPKYDK